MISKDLLKQRFCNASSTYNEHAVVQAGMASKLVDMALEVMQIHNANMLELGCGTGLLTQEILKNFSCLNYILNDIVPDIEKYISPIVDSYQDTDVNFIFGDIEHLNFPKGQSVIWSGATIQWVQNLDLFFQNMHSLLEEKGYLVLSTFGPDNYKEIRSITGQGIGYPTMQELLKFAMPYFKVLKVKESEEVLAFNSPLEVLKHMRLTGVNAVSESSWTRGDLEKFIKKYEAFKQDDKYLLTYHPYYLILQKKTDDSCIHIDLLSKRVESMNDNCIKGI